MKLETFRQLYEMRDNLPTVDLICKETPFNNCEELEVGMVARLKDIQWDDDTCYILTLDFLQYENHNLQLMKADFFNHKTGLYDQKWSERESYKKADMFSYWVDVNDTIESQFTLKADGLFKEYLDCGEYISYVGWLERELTSCRYDPQSQ